MNNEQAVRSIRDHGEQNPPAVVSARLQQLETDYNLLQYQVDGWCVWPVLRFGVAMTLHRMPMDERERIPVKEGLAIAVKDILSLSTLPKSRYVVKTNSLPRSERQGGLYKDIYFDDLLLDFGSYFKIEDVIYKVYVADPSSALIKSDITSTAFKIAARLLARAGIPSFVFDIASNLSLCLRSELSLDTFTSPGVAQMLLRFYWLKRLYFWLLRRIQPEYLLLITSYGDHALVAAAKELGIQVIEFQHGFVDRHHAGYSWSPYALPYKVNMPLPDRFFLYGEYWKQELIANGFWGEELRPVGSLRMDQYRKISATSSGGKCIIVLTTQYTDTAKLVAFMSDFLKMAEGQLELHLFIKLHPGEQSKSAYEAAFKSDKRVSILLGRESPSTFELFTQAHFHVSIASTCHYEALALGVPTAILPLAGYENVMHLYRERHAFLAQTPQDFLDLILRSEHYQVPAEIGEVYFKSGALENMKRELGL